MTAGNNPSKTEGRLYFDAECPFCVASVGRLSPLLRRAKVRATPFADGPSEPEMRLRWPDGREQGGADALISLFLRVWWTFPLGLALAAIPGARSLARALYRKVAARRHCQNGGCRLTRPSHPSGASKRARS